MTDNESAWKTALPGASAVVGIVLVAVGVLMPGVSNSAGAVTDNQAEEYFAASRAVEEAAASTSRRNRQREPATDAEQARELQAARDRFAAAREEVESAKQSKQSLAWWMKVGGFLFVAIGAGGLLMQKAGG
jgi:hypothetical protein